MGEISLNTIRAWRPETLIAAADEAGRKFDQFGKIVDEVKDLTNRSAGASSGTGEEARFAHVDKTVAFGYAKHELMQEHQRLVLEAGYDLTAKRNALMSAIDDAHRAGLMVNSRGGAEGDAPRQNELMRKHAEIVGQAKLELERADADFARKIRDVNDKLKDGIEGEPRKTKDWLTFGGNCKDEPLDPKAEPPDRYKDSDAFSEGDPKATDVRQKDLGPKGDCYLAGTMIALAMRSPKRIRDMIHYDPATGDFIVTFPGRQPIRITRQDIIDNLTLHGASDRDLDNTNTKPLWPAILECAYAKDQAPNVGDMKAQLHKIAEGGWPEDSLGVLTGSQGEKLAPAPMYFKQLSDAITPNHTVTLLTGMGTADDLMRKYFHTSLPQTQVEPYHVYGKATTPRKSAHIQTLP